MAALSNYLENKLLDATLNNTAYTSPSTVYAALFLTDPTDAGTGTEVNGVSYTRVAMPFAAASSGTSLNSSVVQFDQATTDWGTIAYFALFDASTGGNLLYHGALTLPKTISTGDVFQFAINSVSISLA
jgi:hypothetical protein